MKKGLIDRMFGWMMPRGSRALALSKLHMGGFGTRLMRHVMKQKGIESLESLMRSAMEAGAEIVACQMSMDVMGIRAEELIDGVSSSGSGEVGYESLHMKRGLPCTNGTMVQGSPFRVGSVE